MAREARIGGVVLVLAWIWCGLATADDLEDFRGLVDNRVAVRTSLGVRGARASGAKQVELVIGLSVTSACERAESYRIISFEDPAYAYERFVKPARATARREAEADGAAGCGIERFERTLVHLDLPAALKPGARYYVVAQGSRGEMVTGGHCAAEFVFDGAGGDVAKAAADAAVLVDAAVLGLRQVESVGAGIVKLEFGPNFSPAAGSRAENYSLRVNGQPRPATGLGRLSRVDTYWPVGWPFRAIVMHEVFLQMGAALRSGDVLDVEVTGAVCTTARTARLKFQETASVSGSIKVNQVGYLQDSPVKIGYLGRWMGSFPEGGAGSAALEFSDPPEFAVCRESDGKEMFRGRSKLVHRSGQMNEGFYKVDHSGENVYELDFTAFQAAGRYFITVAGVGRGVGFEIGPDVYRRAFEAAAQGLFAQRCGMALGPPYSDWRRVACHDKGITLTSQVRGEKHELKDLPGKVVRTASGAPVTIAARGGHHDAGDYNPRSHLDVARCLMDAYEMAPGKFSDGQSNIPEKANGLPDILDEAHWALRLWTDLQEPDGGVHNGTESAGDPNFIQTVELDPTGDYAYAKDAVASYSFAGAMAQASRIWRAAGKPAEADDWLSRARRAYDWAENQPPSGRKTSERDAKACAAAQLLHTTGEPRFNRDFLAACVWPAGADAEIDAYDKYDQAPAAWAYANCDPKLADPAVQRAVRKAIVARADFFIRYSRTMGYAFIRHPMAPINWGTGAYENSLPVILWAYKLTGDRKYLYWIVRTCDNTLGANPLGRSYITGLGSRCVHAPLHNSRYSHLGEVTAGQQVEGPVQGGDGYRVAESAYPKLRKDFACLYTFVDCHFAIGMDEGMSINQARTMAAFGLLMKGGW